VRQDGSTLYRNLDNTSIRRPGGGKMGRLCIGIWITGVSEGLGGEYVFLQIQITGRGTPGISASYDGLEDIRLRTCVGKYALSRPPLRRSSLLDALKSSWRSGIMVFLLTAWKTSSASNPGCLSRRYGKLTLSKVLHFHFQNPACS
jgi:hypothetical protein